MAILISGSVNFTTRKIISDKEGPYIIVKGSIHQEHIKILKVYAMNNTTSNYIKKI